MLIMDDVFSALDHKTSQEILVRLLGSKGVLRAFVTTVVIATHSRRSLVPNLYSQTNLLS